MRPVDAVTLTVVDDDSTPVGDRSRSRPISPRSERMFVPENVVVTATLSTPAPAGGLTVAITVTVDG